MNYVDLRKLYYKDTDEYKNTYKNRFDSEWTIKVDFPISDKPAFFIQNIEIIQTMQSILRLDKEISTLCRSLPGKALEQYSKKCLIDEIVITNNIEGVYSSRKEIGEALTILEEQSSKKGKQERFVGLVTKYLKLMSKEPVDLSTCQSIRDIYDEIVLKEVVSENKDNAPDGRIFRKDQATIRSVTDKVIHTGITPESKIIAAMEKALSFLNDESIEKLYRISLFHYMIEYIHPFYDGNGRLGRFILSYCISESLEPLLAYRISETIKENIKDYYNAFMICNDPHNLADLTPFLIMMLQMIKKAASELKDSLYRKKYQWDQYEKLIQKFVDVDSTQMFGLYSLLIQAALFGENGISTNELTSIMDISYVTLKKRLNAVDEQNLLIALKVGKEKYYKINVELLDNMLLAD